MSSLSREEADFVNQCISKVSKGRAVRAACLYGSRVAGYSRPDSDIDILVVLERYPYGLKYAYFKSDNNHKINISALVVDANGLLKDAASAFLGEFVVGRLLHIYEPLTGGAFLHEVEYVYKKRVIIEEMQDIIATAGVLGAELLFPLSYIHFSKIKKRVAQYPGAAYSFYKTYSTLGATNIEFALQGYKQALAEIKTKDPELVTETDANADANSSLLQISRDRVMVADEEKTSLRLARRLSLPISSFIVHTYAGRKLFHLMISEAESKIKRRLSEKQTIPTFISNPRREFWKLPEGELITGSADWLAEFAAKIGIKKNNVADRGGDYVITKQRLGNINSRTILCTIQTREGKEEKEEHKVVAKSHAKSKSLKWAALSLWTSPVRTFRVDPLYRLGSEYIALRYIRNLGLFSPRIEAVVLDKRLLVTSFVAGVTLADKIRSFLAGTSVSDSETIEAAGKQLAIVHTHGCSFGNLKPKNVIVSKDSDNHHQQRQQQQQQPPQLYFTDLEQFTINGGDQIWDIAQFVCWGLKYTSAIEPAARLVSKFLDGYMQSPESTATVQKLARSRRHIESFYPVLAPQVARVIKDEVKKRANSS